MGYRQARTRRGFSRGPEKATAKTKTERPPPSGEYPFMEERVQSFEEVVEGTLNSLRRLGSQRFALAPFHEHFDRWLLNLRMVLSEFESNPSVKVDEQFAKECAQALSNIDLALKEKRLMEASLQESVRRINQKLLDSKNLLAQAERGHASKAKEIADRKERAARPVASKLGALKEELNRTVRMRTSFLRSVLKAGARKEAEATQRLDSTKRELATIEHSFATEWEPLQDEYKRRKQKLLEEIADYQREIGNLEANSQVNDAVEERQTACDALINAVNALLQRTEQASEPVSSPL